MISLRRLALSAAVFTAFAALAVSAPVLAAPPDHGHDETDTHQHQNGQGHQGHGNGYGNGHHRTTGVPELDHSVGASAAVLLGGGVLVIVGRRRAKKS